MLTETSCYFYNVSPRLYHFVQLSGFSSLRDNKLIQNNITWSVWGQVHTLKSNSLRVDASHDILQILLTNWQNYHCKFTFAAFCVLLCNPHPDRRQSRLKTKILRYFPRGKRRKNTVKICMQYRCAVPHFHLKSCLAARGSVSCFSRLKGMLARDGFAVPDACHAFSWLITW